MSWSDNFINILYLVNFARTCYNDGKIHIFWISHFFITLPAGLRKRNVRNTEYYLIDSTTVWIQNNVELCVLVLKIVPSFRVINVFCSCHSDFCATQKWTLVPSLPFRWKLIGSNTEGRSRDWWGKKSHTVCTNWIKDPADPHSCSPEILAD